MTLKWGSTTVTAVKWGSTTCTAVYWGSTKVFPDLDKTNFSVGYATMTVYNRNTSKTIQGLSNQGTVSYHNSSYAAASNYTLNTAQLTGSGDYGQYYYYCGNGLRTAGTISLSGKTSITFNVTGSGTNNTTSCYVSLWYGTATPTWTNGNSSTYKLVPSNYTQIGSNISKNWSSSTTENITFTFSGITATAYLFFRLIPSSQGKKCIINSVTLS